MYVCLKTNHYFSHFARAQILSVDLVSEMVTIMFIDYGNIVNVLRNSLCVIQSQFIDLSPYALKCSLHNCLPTSTANTQILQNVS